MIFAHLGGVDEIAVFVVPAVIAILALRWADKRAKARAEEYDRFEVGTKPTDGAPPVGQPDADDPNSARGVELGSTRWSSGLRFPPRSSSLTRLQGICQLPRRHGRLVQENLPVSIA